MLSVDEVYSQLLNDVRPITETETVSLNNANGRILAADVIASVNVPPHDNSAMDGYAVRFADCREPGARLHVAQRIPAGQTGTELQPGTAARIFTGAPVPPGADVIVMQEHTTEDGDHVIISEPVKQHQHIRREGEDITDGKAILTAGTRLRPQDVGLCASIGIANLTVYRPLKIAIFSTGDEIVEPGTPLLAGQIYNSNRYSLIALMQNLGCELIDLGMVEDTLEATKTALRKAAEVGDMIITSGGVSVGEEDHMKPAVEALGRLDMWKIAMKPGKPLAYGRIGDTPFMGLPGNPVSAFVTFILFARPYLLKQQNVEHVLPIAFPVTADFEWIKPGFRQEYLRARLRPNADGNTVATLFPQQGSGVLTSTSWADGLVVMPIGETVQAGDTVNYIPMGDLL